MATDIGSKATVAHNNQQTLYPDTGLPMRIDWPPFVTGERLLDHPATEADVAAQRAAFVLTDKTGKKQPRVVALGLPRWGFLRTTSGRSLGVIVQAEELGGKRTYGVRTGDGRVVKAAPSRFRMAPRQLVFHRHPDYSLDGLRAALNAVKADYFNDELRGDVLAVRRRRGGPVAFVRKASGPVVAQEQAHIPKPRDRQAVAPFDQLLEVSYANLDDMLDERGTLIYLNGVLIESLHFDGAMLYDNGLLDVFGEE